jgi:hypothetical protein
VTRDICDIGDGAAVIQAKGVDEIAAYFVAMVGTPI